MAASSVAQAEVISPTFHVYRNSASGIDAFFVDLFNGFEIYDYPYHCRNSYVHPSDLHTPRDVIDEMAKNCTDYFDRHKPKPRPAEPAAPKAPIPIPDPAAEEEAKRVEAEKKDQEDRASRASCRDYIDAPTSPKWDGMDDLKAKCAGYVQEARNSAVAKAAPPSGTGQIPAQSICNSELAVLQGSLWEQSRLANQHREKAKKYRDAGNSTLAQEEEEAAFKASSLASQLLGEFQDLRTSRKHIDCKVAYDSSGKGSDATPGQGGGKAPDAGAPTP